MHARGCFVFGAAHPGGSLAQLAASIQSLKLRMSWEALGGHGAPDAVRHRSS